MATVETGAVMKFKNNNGDLTVIYPISDDKVITTTGDGSAYKATVVGISSLTAGVSFTMIPHVDSASTSPTIDVNDLGAIRIRRQITADTAATLDGYSDNWLKAGTPVNLMYNGTFWIADIPKVAADDLAGIVPIKHGGTGANTVEGILTNLGIKELLNSGSINITPITTKGTHVDDYTESGIYYFEESYMPSGIPVPDNGHLIVLSYTGSEGAFIYQLWAGGINTYERIYNENDVAEWSSWGRHMISYESNWALPIKSGGTGATTVSGVLNNLGIDAMPDDSSKVLLGDGSWGTVSTGSSSTTTSGMDRKTNTSNSATSYTCTEKSSKIYVVTVGYEAESNVWYSSSIVVDWQAVKALASTTGYVRYYTNINGNEVALDAYYNSGYLKFVIPSNSTSSKIVYVCGYA